MNGDAFGSLLGCLGLLFALAIIVAVLASVVWVYRDAEKRGKTGCLWLLIVWFTWPFGLIAYYLLRDKEVRL